MKKVFIALLLFPLSIISMNLEQAVNDDNEQKVRELLTWHATPIDRILADSNSNKYGPERIKINAMLENYDSLLKQSTTNPDFFTLRDIVFYGFFGLITPQLMQRLQLSKEQFDQIVGLARMIGKDKNLYQQLSQVVAIQNQPK